MILDLAMMAVFLTIGNIAFWKFDPFQPMWRRALKIAVALAITAAVSLYFGRKGVLVWFALAVLPIIYVHGIWLPRHGVNGWTGEPKEKYYALRGWPPPKA